MPIGRTLLVAALLAALIRSAPAEELRLPSVISDHMVLQRDVPVRIWGRAVPGADVEVAFAQERASGRADAFGRWTVSLGALPASAVPRTLTVRSGDRTIRVNDVLVGEVWLCSGQSNMVWTVSGSARADEFIAAADEPRIRMFTVPNVAAHEPQEDCPGDWRVAGPETVGRFSAVAYHFARRLVAELDVPVGLVNSSWGGSTVEAWISRPALERLPAARPFLETYDLHHDLDRMDVGEFVADTVAEEQWGTMTLPGLIEDAGHEIDGVMWFRRTVDVPEAWEGRGLTLTLGAIDDNDVTFFAGSRIGATNNWRAPRTYAVPPELVRAGAAVVAVRVEDTGGAGGFSGTPEQLQLRPADGSGDALPLAGAWSMRVVADRPTGPTQHRPANLYNAMLHPLRQTAFRGAIWYQGESNAIRPRGEEYFTLFPAMIRDWRWTLGARDLPFYYVQLPGFTNDEPNTVWRYPVVRQAQLETLRLVPHTGMAVTLDLGEADDIHPRNKHDVGARLARLALVDTYGVTGLPASAPIFREAEFRGDGVVRVTLDRFGSTLAVRAGEAALAGFELAGSDGTFRPATARLEGDAVLVRSDEVPRPAAVRYAWRNNPTDANLVNAEGWPASPFRAGRAD